MEGLARSFNGIDTTEYGCTLAVVMTLQWSIVDCRKFIKVHTCKNLSKLSKVLRKLLEK